MTRDLHWISSKLLSSHGNIFSGARLQSGLLRLNLPDRRVFLCWHGCKVWIAEVGAKQSFLTAQDGGEWSSHCQLSSAELTSTARD